jgi:mono/diheme cytochrome c family protein
MPRFAGLFAAMALPVTLSPLAAVAAKPDFQREVQPILAEHCAHCHGLDADTRQGGLRLDVRDAVLAGGDSGLPAIVVGKPADSELVRRIRSQDPDEIMPPPREHKPLTPEKMAIIEAWIAEGAEYVGHWAFEPPRKAAPPQVAGGTNQALTHPIDAFVRANLADHSLAPAPRADDHTLCRRLWLDIVGLPPSPADLEAFARDGYEATVDRLLASERYGEKWARHWLDLARYADSNGYEKDMPRDMWAWRDWVIAAFNHDMPYDQFVVEQLAGDLLPNASQDQIVATGFLRNSMLNEEGAIIPEEFRMVEMFDRVDCIGKAVMGLTTGCAQCHSHKFDPLSHEEYFGVFAFFNDTYEARSPVYTPADGRKLDEIRQRIAKTEKRITTERPQWREELAAWERQVSAGLVPWTVVEMEEMSSNFLLCHPTQRADGSILMLGHRDKVIDLDSAPDLAGVTGLRLEALTDRDLPSGGPDRDGTWGLAELDVRVKKPGATAWETLKLVHPTADFAQPERKVPHPDAAKKGNGKADAARATDKDTGPKLASIGPVANLIDDDRHSSWDPDRGPLLRHQPSCAVVQFEQPLDLPAGTKLRVSVRMMGHMSNMLGCCRVSLTKSPAPVALAVDHAAILAVAKPAEKRTAADTAAIFTAWRKTVPQLASINDEIAGLWAAVPEPLTSVMHLANRSADQHRPTHRLDRGVWNAPKEEIEPHVPAALHPFPPDVPKDRLGFARWLVDERSPLAARVAVNRIWQALFGQGLVETPDDFGTRAPVPEYRNVLDWLAVDFMEQGWSQKRAIRQIVMSETYRQSSAATPETLSHDPNNRFLARGPRFRPDAEVVRDVVLAVSGLLKEKVGGPSVYPPVPQNVLDYNFTPIPWPEAKGPDRYRRSLYTFRRRSMPDPALGTFDAPTGDISCARRVRSNTPLAALTGLNEPIFVEAARVLALRTLKEGGSDDASRLDHAFLLCTSRKPSAVEKQEILAFLAAQRQKFADGWLNPREVATGSAEKLPPLPAGTTPQDAGAWTLAARVLLNLDETVTKN